MAELEHVISRLETELEMLHLRQQGFAEDSRELWTGIFEILSPLEKDIITGRIVGEGFVNIAETANISLGKCYRAYQSACLKIRNLLLSPDAS